MQDIENIKVDVINVKHNVIPSVACINMNIPSVKLNVNQLEDINDVENVVKNENNFVHQNDIENDETKKEEKEYNKEMEEIMIKEMKKDEMKMIIENKINEQKYINDKMRRILIDWIFEVVTYEFRCSLDTFLLTVNIINLYSSIDLSIKKENYQLIGLSSLHIAMKYNEIINHSIDDFVIVCDHAYNKTTIIEYENNIMNRLKYNFIIPTSLDFIRIYDMKIHSTTTQHWLSKYLILLTTLDSDFINCSPSFIASIALYCQRSLMHIKPEWNDDIYEITGYSIISIYYYATKLLTIYTTQSKSNNHTSSMYKIFSSVGCDSVSTLTISF